MRFPEASIASLASMSMTRPCSSQRPGRSVTVTYVSPCGPGDAMTS